MFKVSIEGKIEDKQLYLDTMPIELVLGVRCNRSKVVREFYRYGIKPDCGHCESKQKKYFGFKLVALCLEGKIIDFILVSAKLSEQASLMKFVMEKNLKGLNIFGDKGFQMSEDDRKILSDRKIKLEIPPKKNLKNPPKVDDLYFKIRTRRIIETVFGQLNDTFKINDFIVRSALGFTALVVRKIVSYNFKQIYF